MPVLNFGDSIYRLTDTPLTQEELAFDVYEHYLSNFHDYIKNLHPSFEAFINHILSQTQKIQGNKSLNLAYIKKFVFLAWNTEYLSRLNDTSNNVEIKRINNSWKPIQVYYSVYSLTEATTYALTNSKTENHTKCLNKMSQYLINTDLEPWNLGFKGYKGNKTTPSTIVPINFPPDTAIPNSLQRSNVSPSEVIALCLKAEHRNRIKEYVKKGSGELKYKYDPKPTTLLHFLYRLRIKSNYKTVEQFLADAPDQKIIAFSNNLTFLNVYTNTLMELLLARRIGKSNLINLMKAYQKMVPSSPIEKRIDLYFKNNNF